MQLPPQSGDVFEVAIDGVAYGGDGIGRISGLACFVSGALPGDVVRVRIYRHQARAVWGRLLSIITPSPERSVPSLCAEKACESACAWQAFRYPAQAIWKRRIVQDTLERIGRVAVEVGWLEQPELRNGYRTRALFHGDGTAVGYFRQRTHDVIRLDACPLNHPRLNQALEHLQIPGIRGDVQVTVNPEGEETLMWLRREIAAVRERFPMTDTRLDAVRHRFLFDGVPIVNGAFSQSSLLLNRMLRNHTDTCIQHPDSLIDLYCGNGNLSLHYAGLCDVLGVDHAGVSVAAAADLAPGAYVEGDEQTMVQFLKKRAWEVILLDPPRTGAWNLVEALKSADAARIVYVSCNPATLARDIRGITEGGWKVTQAVALDLFPHTPHVETVCVFERS